MTKPKRETRHPAARSLEATYFYNWVCLTIKNKKQIIHLWILYLSCTGVVSVDCLLVRKSQMVVLRMSIVGNYLSVALLLLCLTRQIVTQDFGPTVTPIPDTELKIDESLPEEEIIVVPIEVPTPIPTPEPIPCLSTNEGRAQCNGTSRSNAFGTFASIVDVRAFRISPAHPRYGCVKATDLIAFYDSMVTGLPHASTMLTGSQIFSGCESPSHIGHVCVRELDLLQCGCINTCDKLHDLTMVGKAAAIVHGSIRLPA